MARFLARMARSHGSHGSSLGSHGSHGSLARTLVKLDELPLTELGVTKVTFRKNSVCDPFRLSFLVLVRGQSFILGLVDFNFFSIT